MRHTMFLSATICLVLASNCLHAASIQSIHVDKQGNAYQIRARVVMAVSRQTAFAAATDFSQLPAYSPSIESERLMGNHEVASTMHLCVAMFCRTIHQVMRYSTQPPTRLDMQVVSGTGNLNSGSVHWRFEADGPDRTTLFFQSNTVPGFWVPPLIGTLAVKHAMRKQMIETAKAVESLAQAKSKAGG